MKLARCRSCNAAIVWLKTSTGKNMPIDADFMAQIVDDLEHDPAPMFDYREHQKGVHWATCPHADHHRSKR